MSDTPNIPTLRQRYSETMEHGFVRSADAFGFYQARFTADAERKLRDIEQEMAQACADNSWREWTIQTREQFIAAHSTSEAEKLQKIGELQKQYVDQLAALDAESDSGDLSFSDPVLMKIYGMLDDIATPIGVDMDTWVEKQFKRACREREERLHPKPKPKPAPAKQAAPAKPVSAPASKPSPRKPTRRKAATPPPPPQPLTPPPPPQGRRRQSATRKNPLSDILDMIRDQFRRIMPGNAPSGLSFGKSPWLKIAIALVAVSVLTGGCFMLAWAVSGLEIARYEENIAKAQNYLDKGEYEIAIEYFKHAQKYNGLYMHDSYRSAAREKAIATSSKVIEEWLQENRTRAITDPQKVIRSWRELPNNMIIKRKYYAECKEILETASAKLASEQ